MVNDIDCRKLSTVLLPSDNNTHPENLPRFFTKEVPSLQQAVFDLLGITTRLTTYTVRRILTVH